MAGVDPKVSVPDVLNFVESESAVTAAKFAKEQDEENKAYFSGQLDVLERLEAFLTK